MYTHPVAFDSVDAKSVYRQLKYLIKLYCYERIISKIALKFTRLK